MKTYCTVDNTSAQSYLIFLMFILTYMENIFSGINCKRIIAKNIVEHNSYLFVPQFEKTLVLYVYRWQTRIVNMRLLSYILDVDAVKS